MQVVSFIHGRRKYSWSKPTHLVVELTDNVTGCGIVIPVNMTRWSFDTKLFGVVFAVQYLVSCKNCLRGYQ